MARKAKKNDGFSRLLFAFSIPSTASSNEIARRIGVSRRTVQRWRMHGPRYNTAMLIRFGRRHKVSADYLLEID